MFNALTGEELNRRLNTIALNAVREAQIAIGRGHLQWCDDDWRRMNMISQILDLTRIEAIDGGNEHYSLLSPFQAKKNPGLDLLESKLADALANVGYEDEPPATGTVIGPTPSTPKRAGGQRHP